jgi:hypothetical protein
MCVCVCVYIIHCVCVHNTLHIIYMSLTAGHILPVLQFTASQGTCVVVQCTGVNIKVSFATEGR